MRRAAEGGEPRAMANLALLLLDDGTLDDAHAWVVKAVGAAPLYANAQRALGKVALAQGQLAEAHGAFEQARALEPANHTNAYNLALVLVREGRASEARPLLEQCLGDPRLDGPARALLEVR